MDVIIVDDNIAFREGLKTFIETGLGFKVIASFKDGKHFLNSEDYYNADIVLMDIEMPNINGIEATKQALSKHKDLKVIAITNYQSKAYLTELIFSGFKACVFKNDVFKELSKAIKMVLNNQLYYPEDINLDNEGN